ncbi:MAG: L,D-transpeptidase family protein [Patescibacteria group bacterium]|nr:L,D-transpeptidase family protein [Patescibacteria group bacterium]
MFDRRGKSIGIILTAVIVSALFACPMTTAFAAGPAKTEVVRPEVGLWKPVFSGDPSRIPGDFKTLASSSVGSVAVQDLDRDDVAEIVVGSGFNQEPSVGIFRADGSLLLRFAVYDPGMKKGVNVATGDIDGDGRAEIITGTGPGAAAHVLVFDDQGRMKSIAGGFFPFGREFRGGVSVAAGDVDGDGLEEIITAAGPGGEPRVMVWKKPFSAPIADLMAFDKQVTVGVDIAAGDVDGDGREEILAVPAVSVNPLVRIFEAADPGTPVGEFKVGDGSAAGLNLDSVDLDDDGLAEILVASNGSGSARVSVFDRTGKLRTSFHAGEVQHADELLVAAGHLTAADKLILAVPADTGIVNRPTEPKSITVNITEQRLHAYEYGREVKTFLVSTGTRSFPTPLGNYSVLAKKPYVLYRWSYGPDDPNNYDLGLTPWNLSIMPHIYIHYAPWHNNFGRRMSHGCINVNLTNIKWIYDWAEVGVPVDISG